MTPAGRPEIGTSHTTRNEAILREIVEPIQAGGEVADAYAEYDIEAIASAVLGDYTQGFACIVDHEEFWATVEEAELA
jgi:hypothetical protein